MTEIIKPNIPKDDKTVVRNGLKELPGVGMKCTWELHALPEYVESDVALSERVIGEVSALLEQKGIKNLTIDLTEGYDEEELGKEHYRLKMIFGEGNEGKKIIFSKHYKADTDDGLIGGIVRTKSSEVAMEIANIYIKEMEETYPEWKNQWDEGKLEII